MDTKARIYINKYMRMFVCFCAALFLMLWTPRITAWADGGSQNGVNWSCDGSSLWVSGATIPTVGRTSYPWYRYVSGVTYINVDVNGGIGDNASLIHAKRESSMKNLRSLRVASRKARGRNNCKFKHSNREFPHLYRWWDESERSSHIYARICVLTGIHYNISSDSQC